MNPPRQQASQREKAGPRASGNSLKLVDEGACAVFAFNEDRVMKAREAMLPDPLLQDVVETFKALASPTRVRIIQALAQGELCVCDMSKVLGLSVSATSHQLRALRKIKLVSHRTEGKMVYYSLRDSFVHDLLLDATRHVSGGGAAT